jgi:hypothetical protein
VKIVENDVRTLSTGDWYWTTRTNSTSEYVLYQKGEYGDWYAGTMIIPEKLVMKIVGLLNEEKQK